MFGGDKVCSIISNYVLYVALTMQYYSVEKKYSGSFVVHACICFCFNIGTWLMCGVCFPIDNVLVE